jgi:hypothetical protein
MDLILNIIITLCVLAFPAFGLYYYIAAIKPKKRLYKSLSNVKNGQKIKVNISGFVNDAICLNNSPSDKKMFIRYIYSNGKTSDSVEKYDEFTFINFNALNITETEKPHSPNKEPKAGNSPI